VHYGSWQQAGVYMVFVRVATHQSGQHGVWHMSTPHHPSVRPLPVSLQNDTQLGFFFFNKADAEAIIDKVSMQ
jgi:hypothetical protein